MSDDKKFILCPSCGAILEKGIIFCSYCGKNVEESKKEDLEQRSYQPQVQPQPQPTRQQNYQNQRGFGQRSMYDRRDQEFVFDGDMEKRLDAENKIRQATIFSYLALCIPYISIIFLIVTVVFSFQAKKILGFWDPRIVRALVIATFGTLTDAVYIFIFFRSF
jgi:uncharacterized Zn finger protein (UPF0148 family)